MLGAIYPEMSAKYATDLDTARVALAEAIVTGVGVEPAIKNLKLVMETVWASGYLIRPIVKTAYVEAMDVLLTAVPEQTYIDTFQKDLERYAERGGIGLGGILIGVGIGYLIFSKKTKKRG